MPVTATTARKQFINLCEQAKIEPVVVSRYGVPDSVLMSYEEFQARKLLGSLKNTMSVERESNA